MAQIDALSARDIEDSSESSDYESDEDSEYSSSQYTQSRSQDVPGIEVKSISN